MDSPSSDVWEEKAALARQQLAREVGLSPYSSYAEIYEAQTRQSGEAPSWSGWPSDDDDP
jgi:hypothetical protein